MICRITVFIMQRVLISHAIVKNHLSGPIIHDADIGIEEVVGHIVAVSVVVVFATTFVQSADSGGEAALIVESAEKSVSCHQNKYKHTEHNNTSEILAYLSK